MPVEQQDETRRAGAINGPWSVPDGGVHPTVCDRDGVLLATMADTGDEAEAVARMMAAAPEMLAALLDAAQFIINGVELGFIRMPDVDTPDPAHRTLPRIRAAIAKATGA